MSLLGNVLWILSGGFLVAFFYIFGGLVLCLTVIGIPFGVQLLKLAVVSLAPFGHDIDTTSFASGCLGITMNVLWIIAGGIWLTIVHLALALLLGITIVGIPFAKQHLKMARLALMPFGSVVD